MTIFGLFDLTADDADEAPIQLLKGPDYYDNPEGTDPIGKLWGINKYAIFSAYTATTIDVLCVSHVKTVPEVLNVAGFWFLPLMGCATAFASVAYVANDIRKKDDRINYVLGALACAPVLHAWRNNLEFTCKSTAFLMICAALKKWSLMQNYSFFNKPNVKYVGNYEFDFSLVSEEWPKRPI